MVVDPKLEKMICLQFLEPYYLPDPIPGPFVIGVVCFWAEQTSGCGDCYSEQLVFNCVWCVRYWFFCYCLALFVILPFFCFKF